VGIWVVVCIQKPSHHFLQTFCPIGMFKIVFSDSSFYPKQLCLFCLLWLISACADRIVHITNFCSMIKLLHELKTAVVDIEAFRHLIMSQQGKRTTKTLLDFHTYKKSKVFLRTSCTFSIVQFSKIRSCKPEGASSSQAAHFLYSATRIRLDQLCPARGPNAAQSKVLCGPV